MYSYNFNYNFPNAGLEEFRTAINSISVPGAVMSLVLAIAVYVIRAMSLHTIAKRRGLNHPWLAWLPVGCQWLLGSVSDQYRYLVKDENKSGRKVLLGLSIGQTAVFFILLIQIVSMVVNVVLAGNSYNNSAVVYSLLGQMMGLLGLFVVLIVVNIVLAVFWYICLYDVFRSCQPANAVLFLVLSIVGNLAQSLFAPVILMEPILLLLCRNKDGGMPPRREAAQTQDPYYPTAYPQLDEQPKEEYNDPWENQ